ncbi:MAG: tetratricopeptide repeat protein [Kiritimatiellaeota bacterium]|nr:tetratricopeptide repeat protein [Kiritimatiellota bacterium]
MKRRVNLGLLVFVVGGALVLAFLAVVLYRARRDPRRFRVRAARQARAGEYEKAAANYARAIRRNDRDPATYLEFARTLAKLPPQPPETALARTQQMVSALEHAVELDPGAGEARARLMNYYLGTARATRAPEAWQLVKERSGAILASLKRHNQKPGIPLLRARALASSHLLQLQPDPARPRIAAVLAQLEAVHEQAPEDPLIPIQIARWHAAAAAAARRDGKEKAADVEWARADRLVPENSPVFATRVARLRLALDAGRVSGKEFRNNLAELDPLAASQQDSFALRQLAQLWLLAPAASKADRTDSLEHAEALLRRTVRANPLDVAARLELADVLRRRGRVDDALDLAENVRRRSEKLPVGVVAVTARYYAPAAGLIVADLCLDRAAAATAAASRAVFIARARKVLDDVAASPRFAAAVTVRRVRLELLEGRPGPALDLLGVAGPAGSRRDPARARLSVTVLEAAGETGEAVRRLEALIKSGAGSRVSDPLHLAALELRAGRPAAALKVVAGVLADRPRQVRARVLEFLALADLARRRDIQGDLKAQETLVRARAAFDRFQLETAPPEVVLAAIRLLDWFGLVNDAGRLSARATSVDAPSLSLVRAQVAFALRQGRKAEAAAAIRRAQRLYPDNPSLARAAAELDRGGPFPAITRLLVPAAGDGIAPLLAWADYCAATGRGVEAGRALRDAEQAAPSDPRVLRACFAAALARSDSTAAAQLADRLDRLERDPIRTALRRARIAIRRREYDQAEALVRGAVERRPLGSEGWWLLGEILRAKRNFRGAADAYGRALRLRPELVPARSGLAEILSLQGERRAAVAELEEAAALLPEDFVLWQTCLDALGVDEPDRAVRLRERLAKRLPGDHRNRRALAALQARLGREGEAEKLLTDLVAETPGDPGDAWALARFYDRRGNHAKGKAVMRAFLARKDGKPDFTARLLYARYLAATSLDKEAREAYRRAMEIEDEKTLPATLELARTLMRRRRVAEALPYFKRAAATVRDRGVLASYIGALAAAGRDKEAMVQLAVYKKRFGADSGSAVLAGLMWAHRGDVRKAAAAFDRAVQLGPRDARAFFLRARFRFQYRSAGQWARIRDDLRKAIELSPRFLPPRELLTEWYLESRPPDRGAAAAELRKILEFRPDYTPARLQLADLFLSAGKYWELQSFLDESRRRLPGLAVWDRISAALAAARGKPEAALMELERFYRKEQNAAALELYAGALIGTGKVDKCIDVLSAPSVPAATPLLRALKGRALVAVGRKTAGQAELAAALELAATRNTQLLEVIAQVARALSPPQAAALLDTAGDKIPTRRFEFESAAADVLRGAGDYAAAVARLAALHPQQVEPPKRRAALLKGLASLYVLLGRFEEAQSTYRQVLRITPDDAAVLNDLAFLLTEHLDRPESAAPLAEKALERSEPYSRIHAAALDTLGWTRFRAGKHGPAEFALRQSVQEWPQVGNRLHLAQVLASTGRKDEARSLIAAAEKAARHASDRAALARIESVRKKVLGP